MRSRSHINVKDVYRICVYYHIYMVLFLNWSMTQHLKQSGFNLHFVYGTIVWLVLVKKNGTMHVTCVAGSTQELMGHRVTILYT